MFEEFSDYELNGIAPSDKQLRALVEIASLVAKESDVLANQYEPECTPLNVNCTRCGNFCPSGTLENGLCNDCDLIGKRVLVDDWGRWGMQSCLVTRVSKNGTIYAKRWFKSLGGWSAERPIHFYKNCYHLGSRHKSEGI